MRVTSKVTLVLSMGVVSGILLLLLVGLGERRPAVDTLSPAAAAPQAPAQDVVDSPLPLPPVPARPVEEIPTLEIIVITPPPDGGVIVLPPVTPGQIYALPTFTPFPTRTPRPTAYATAMVRGGGHTASQAARHSRGISALRPAV
jgi:hypothetical protein